MHNDMSAMVMVASEALLAGRGRRRTVTFEIRPEWGSGMDTLSKCKRHINDMCLPRLYGMSTDIEVCSPICPNQKEAMEMPILFVVKT